MTKTSGFKQARVPATMLRTTALAMALIAQTSLAHGETIDLTCASTGGGSSFLFPSANIRLLVETSGSTVTEISDGGAGHLKSNPLAAAISNQFIKYSGPLPGNSDYSLMGTLDRSAGTLRRTIRDPTGAADGNNYMCRRATQKF